MTYRRLNFDIEAFRTHYRQAVADVMSFWTPEMQQEIARHNVAWGVGRTDFGEYLIASEKRYEICCKALWGMKPIHTICDVGGFFGAFPLAMQRMGYQVSMTEALKYYSQSFDRLFSYLRAQGVEIVNYDPFDAVPPPQKQYDAITVMAVLEHYPHSLRQFMHNLRQCCSDDTVLYFEVPNIAYFPKRWNMIFGRSPLVAIEDIYDSASPFTGHHHEYTMRELIILVENAGYSVLHQEYFNYSFRAGLFRGVISHPLLTFSALLPGMREIIAVAAKPMRASTVETGHL